MYKRQTYTWTFSYDAKDGTTPATATQALTINQITMKKLALVNLTMEYTENTGDKPVVTVDNIFAPELAKGDTKADLFKDMTFAWAAGDRDMSAAGNTHGVEATLSSVNYKLDGTTYSDGKVKGTMTATGKMDSEIVVTGETDFVYDGKEHTLTASLLGAAANETTNKPSASITYTDADGKVVAAPKNVGVYTATATMINKGNHDALDVVKTVTITAATPTLAFKGLPEDKTAAYNSADASFKNLDKNYVEITAANGEKLTVSYLNLYWADADGKQLYNAKDEDGNAIVTTDSTVKGATAMVLAEGLKLPGDYYLTAQYVVIDPETGKLKPAAGTVDANYTDSAAISEKFTITASSVGLDKIATFEDAVKDGEVNTIHYGDKLEGAVLVDLKATSTNTTGMLPGKYVITKPATEKANKVGETSYTVKFIPSDAGYTPVELTRKATVEVAPAVFTKDVQFKINNTSVSYDGKAHTLGEAVGAGVTILKDGLAFAGDDAGFKVEYSDDKATWTTDVTKFAYTNKGGYAVYVRITDSKGNYVMPGAPFMGKVSIGVVAATLKVEDKTVTYSTKGAPSVSVGLYDADGKLLANVPSTAYTVLFHEATEHPNDKSFTAYDSNAKLHANDKAYWVQVTLSNAGYLGYSVEDAVAYSRYTVNKADLTTANLTKVVNKTTLDSTDTFDGTSTVNDKLGTSVDALTGDNTEKTAEIAGTWGWAKNADGTYPLLEVATNYDLVYTVTNTKDDNTSLPYASDFNTMAKTITVKGVKPGVVTVTEDVSVTPDKGTYGLTVGDLTLKNPSDTSVFTFTFGGKAIKGTLAFNDPADTVIPMAKTGADSTELGLVFIPTTGKAANYKLDDGHDSVNVTIEKAEPVITVTNTTMGYTGNPASLKVETNNTEAEPKLTWYDANGNTIAGAPTQIGSYKVKVSLPETNSFLAKSVKMCIRDSTHTATLSPAFTSR